jgi:hypothetical protein
MISTIFFCLMAAALVWTLIKTVYRAVVFLILSAPIIAVIVAFALGYHFS